MVFHLQRDMIFSKLSVADRKAITWFATCGFNPTKRYRLSICRQTEDEIHTLWSLALLSRKFIRHESCARFSKAKKKLERKTTNHAFIAPVNSKWKFGYLTSMNMQFSNNINLEYTFKLVCVQVVHAHKLKTRFHMFCTISPFEKYGNIVVYLTERARLSAPKAHGRNILRSRKTARVSFRISWRYSQPWKSYRSLRRTPTEISPQ